MGCCESRGKCKNKIIVPDSFTNEDSQIQIDFSDNNQYQTAKWPSSNYNSHQPQNHVNSLENVFYQMKNNAVPKNIMDAIIIAKPTFLSVAPLSNTSFSKFAVKKRDTIVILESIWSIAFSLPYLCGL